LWEGGGALPDLTLRDGDGRWTVNVPPAQVRVDGVLLDWRELRIPTDAPDGEALLALPDGTELARFMIQSIPVLTDPPSSGMVTDARFPLIGTLVGYSWEQEEILLASTPEITLVWRADNATITDYTVFVQLLNAEGAVIAQSDAMPAQGDRPTSGWRTGEYIVDRHILVYNALAQAGTAQLIVGWYDASTNRRLTLEDGADVLVLDSVNIGPDTSSP
jgi:hypothetical protein